MTYFMATPPTSGDSAEGADNVMNLNLIYSSGQVARMLGITEPQLNNHIRRGNVPAVAPMAGGRRIWSQADVDAAREALAARAAAPGPRLREEAANGR
ncbi:MAG: MerR family transcriptional regulator [Planctomycetota bacterium]